MRRGQNRANQNSVPKQSRNDDILIQRMGTASLTWLDLTASDRDKARRVLDLFSEQGTVDELGFGSLRDALSNALFPGTSVLHTRLRYVLFVPWVYQRIESWGGGFDPAKWSRKLEVQLIDALAASDDPNGVIGIHSREKLARMASNAYWACLVRWGIFMSGQSQGWYHQHLDGMLAERRNPPRVDDPGVVWAARPTWHPRLPAPPVEFPEKADFALTTEEADFLVGRIESRCAGSLLAWLAREGSATPAEDFWSDPDVLRADSGLLKTVELARRFSLHVLGAALLYNLLLAELRAAKAPLAGGEQLLEHYRKGLADWAEEESAEQPFEPEQLWGFLARNGGRALPAQRRFLESWTERISRIGPSGVVDDTWLRDLIAQRERQLKGTRARVDNVSRLLDWNGQTGVARMRFRWQVIQSAMTDLHQGLGR